MPYNPQASGGSNLAVSNPELDKQITHAFSRSGPLTRMPVRTFRLNWLHRQHRQAGWTMNITPQAAVWQIPRVAKARNLSVEQLTQLIAKYSQQPLVKYIGQPVVNIVELNLALDKLNDQTLTSDPDRLLEQTAAPHQGKLKVFFGACAGVGKTWAMLAEAQRLRAQGLDIVVGVVETIGRKDTAAMLEGLAVLPPKRQAYRGRHIGRELISMPPWPAVRR